MPRYRLKVTNSFKHDVKRCKKRGLPLEELWYVVELLLRGDKIPDKYRLHSLHGNHVGEWECHIRPDWLLVWRQYEEEVTLLFTNTGTHSDIFGKNKK